jgi:hypothetical protein
MVTKKGTPEAIVKIWTDDLKITLTAAMGDSDTEILQVTTQKDLSSPSGSFTLVLVPRKDANGQTWFDKLDAMDYVEIYFRGINDDASHIAMRGLIDKVTKTENWEGGIPDRTIAVTGRDLGSVFTDHGIYFMPELGGTYAKMALGGVGGGVIIWADLKDKYQPISTVSDAFNIIITYLSEGLKLKFGKGQIDLNDLLWYESASTFPEDITTYGNLKTYQGDFWNALAWYADKPFHELILYDSDAYANIILRPARLKDAVGNYHKSVNDLIAQNANVLYPDLDNFKFSNADVVSNTLEKSHSEVYNYYLTYPSMCILEKLDLRAIELDLAGGDPTKVTNPFFQMDPNLPAYIGKYGFRKYEGGTVFVGSPEVGQTGPNNTRGKKYNDVALKKSIRDRIRERNQMVVAWFLHNEHLLSGQIDIAGTNQPTIGTYAQNTDDDMEYYIEGVTHTFVQFRSFRTTLRVTRGQFTKDKGGLIGLGQEAEYKYYRYNRFYFDTSGVMDNNPPTVSTTTAPTKTKAQPAKATTKPKMTNRDKIVGTGLVKNWWEYGEGGPGTSNF